ITEPRRRMRALHVMPFAVLLAAVACEPSTGPDRAKLNTAAALADYKALENVFASDGWAGFQALGGRSPMSSSAAVATMSALSDLRSGTTARAFALNLFREVAVTNSAVRASTEAVISSVHLGKTLVYNTTADRYVIDVARTGAPANGTRFILYEVGVNGKPIGAQEIGHADLIDEGANAGAAIALRLVGVERGRTLIDYRLRVEPQDDGGTIDVSGFLAGENGARLDFTIGVVGTTSGAQTTVDLEFELAMAQRDFEVDGTVRGVDGAGEGEGTVHLTVHHGENTLQVDMDGEAGVLDGAIRLNDNAFVTVTGPASDPVLRNASGQPLNGQEVLLVLAIVDVTDGVFDLVENLLRPVDNLVALGWIL
ncbi:MAG: hypothetical protein ABMA00_22730, partial [Gemmatimonas sp.]